MVEQFRSGIVPLFAPSMHHLRAGAVWVTIANWAAAMSGRYGGSKVVTSDEIMDAQTVRAKAWRSQDPGQSRPRRLGEGIRTLAKDLRWAGWSGRDACEARRLDLAPFERAPYVWQHHDLFAMNGLVAAKRLGRPIVLFVDAPQVWEARQWGVTRPGWGRPLEYLAERHQFIYANVVACVTEEVAVQVSEISRGQAKVLVTPCTAELPTENKRLAVRERLGLANRFVVGWVGSFRRFHNVEMLIRAASLLRSRTPNLTLLLIGDGPTKVDCQELARELGVDCRFTGSVPNADVAGLLQASDVGVLPSSPANDFHYSPLKLKEYMAVGLPGVVPRFGEMARSMTDGTDVLFYDPGGEEQLADAISRLAESHALRQTIARGGTALLQREFSLDDQLARIEEALGSSRPRA